MQRVLGWAVVLPILLTARALANPYYSDVVFTHVQPHSGDFCDTLAVSGCPEIVQATTLRGTLDFDLILDCWWDPHEWEHLTCRVRWPSDWLFVAGEACGGDGAAFKVFGNEAAMRIPGVEDLSAVGYLFGLTRITLEVASEGDFEILSVSALSPGSIWLGAQAGRECGNCSPVDCMHSGLPTTPWFTPETLQLQVEEGAQVVDSLTVRDWGMSENVEFEFSSSVEWLSLEAVNRGSPSSPDYLVTATADAASLSPGTYEAWIEAACDRCYECAAVELTVLESTQPAVEATTWGRVKSAFRRGR